MARRAVLQYFIILLAINGLHSSAFNRNSLGIISQLLRKDSRDPLIVVVDTSKKIRALEEDLYDDEDRNEGREVDDYTENNINHKKVNEKYDKVLFNVLRTSNYMSDYERREIKRKQIEKAIRDRCQARVVCTEKCSAEHTALRKRYCQKSCKAVFDHLVKCPPPGNEWKTSKKPKPKPKPKTTTPKDSCGDDSCASKNSCDDDSCKPKDSCDDDSCKSKDSCEDSCGPTTKKPRTGKTCPPTWRY